MRRPALLVLAALLVAGVAQASPGEKVKSDAPQLLDLRLDNGSTPFAEIGRASCKRV